MKLKVLGCFSPNIEFKPVSMYKVELEDKNIIYLDMGYGNHNKVDYKKLNSTAIIISHNHVDHVYGLIELVEKLRKDKVKLKNKIKVYMPKGTNLIPVKRLIKTSEEYLEITFINEDLKFQIGEYEISFCKTLHKGESYATKIVNLKTKNIFVYTADIGRVTENLLKFCSGANQVLIDSGHPVFFQPFKLGRYHDYTRFILRDIIKAKPKKIYLTHFKTYASDKMFERYYPKTSIDIELVRLNNEYEI